MRDFELYNEDCAEGLKKIDSESIDLVVTSPPYDNLRTYNGFSFDFETIAKELYRVVKNGGVIVWIVSDGVENGSETGTSFKQALYFKEIGFKLHDTMIYAKNNPIPQNHNRYEQCFEYMFILSKGRPKTFNPIKIPTKNNGELFSWGDRKTNLDKKQCRRDRAGKDIKEVKATKIHDNIFYYSIGGGRTGHPAVFPNKLAHDHITTWSNRGEKVLDPFSGSGTTAIEALNNGRQFIGFEISKDYYEKSLQRIKDETAQMNIFDFIGEKSN